MKYQIVGKNISVTEAISNAIETKFDKLDKYFGGKDVDCRAVISSHDTNTKIEATIYYQHIILRAEVKDKDLYAAMDQAVDKIKGQIRKLKTRMDRSSNKLSLAKSIEFQNVKEEQIESANDIVVRTKSYRLEPMKIDEAIARMDALGHDFFVYLDSEEEKVSVVYVRKDGGYGVIEVENPLK